MQAFETAAPAPAFGRTAFADFVSAGLLVSIREVFCPGEKYYEF